jgi:hypothetical protein
MAFVDPAEWARQLSVVTDAPYIVMLLIGLVGAVTWWGCGLIRKARIDAAEARVAIAKDRSEQLNATLDAANGQLASSVQQLQTGIGIDQLRLTVGAARRLVEDARTTNAAMYAGLASDVVIEDRNG